MSDESSAEIRATRTDFMTEHRLQYLRSGGAEGHVVDITPVGGFAFSTHCLIRYTGRRSGKVFITPLCYVDVGGEVTVCASKGGADAHPDWYLNLVARPECEFQVATQAWRGSWREPEGAERQRVWDALVGNFPFYANYQASTTRVIPLVMMKPAEVIPVFREEDATGVRQL